MILYLLCYKQTEMTRKKMKLEFLTSIVLDVNQEKLTLDVEFSKFSVAHAIMALVQALMDLGTSACVTTVGREMIAVNVFHILSVPTKKTIPVCCQMNVTVQKIPLTAKDCAKNYVSEQKIL